MAENEIHAHIETYSRDCDGSYSGSHMFTLTDEERANRPADGVNDFTDIDFTDRVVSSVVNAYSLLSEATLTVTRLGDGDIRLSWNEPTDEGFRQTEATICTDPCDLGESATQRDHRAGEMGY